MAHDVRVDRRQLRVDLHRRTLRCATATCLRGSSGPSMSLLAPLYLFLGAAALVPLLIHLLRRRIGTRIDFPAARYLARAEQEHSRSLRLRNILLMLLRVA